jgi:ABC-2 type transport system ATP-binding protein
MIDVRECHKRFGATQALSGLNFQAHPGEIFGLLGPNGAGKTTIIHIIAGIDQADDGTVTVNGHDVRKEPSVVRSLVGLIPQEPGFYGALSARENLNFWGSMYGVPNRLLGQRIDELLELTGLRERAHEPVSRFSGGMRRRLNLALGLVHRPAVILLDEPTLEVDPQSRRQIVDFVSRLARQDGATVLYTTHQLGDAQEVCDRIAIMDRGQIIAAGTLDELRRHLPASNTLRIEFAMTVDEELQRRLEQLPGAGKISITGGVVSIEIDDPRPLLSALADVLILPGVTGFRFEEASLETVFLHLTGRRLRD